MSSDGRTSEDQDGGEGRTSKASSAATGWRWTNPSSGDPWPVVQDREVPKGHGRAAGRDEERNGQPGGQGSRRRPLGPERS
ncbi:hypothetical protein PF011_g13902, partial [Phytophthora fragariae]